MMDKQKVVNLQEYTRFFFIQRHMVVSTLYSYKYEQRVPCQAVNSDWQSHLSTCRSSYSFDILDPVPPDITQVVFDGDLRCV